MGTNYHRIPTVSELEKRQQLLLSRVRSLDMSAAGVCQGFSIDNPDGWDRITPWDEFIDEVDVHLGKSSMGWKFTWNFHKNAYYSDKASLEAFVRSGRVIDEYGEEISPDDFLEMAYNWCPDGYDDQTYYAEHPSSRVSWIDYDKYRDTYVDGLRVSSSTDFS
jgi:hypothetical protein